VIVPSVGRSVQWLEGGEEKGACVFLSCLCGCVRNVFARVCVSVAADYDDGGRF